MVIPSTMVILSEAKDLLSPSVIPDLIRDPASCLYFQL